MAVQVAFQEKKLETWDAMPHRGMASLASVGLDGKPWLSASLRGFTHFPPQLQEKAEG